MSPAQGARDASLEAHRHAFKLAQGKFPPHPGLAADEREKLRGEAVAFIREVCFRDGATHYQLLNVPANATRDAIKESYHLLMALIHPDRAEGARESWPGQCAQRANRAYAVLCNAALRAEYDRAIAPVDPFPPRPHRSLQPRRRRGSRIFFRLGKAALALGAVVAMLLAADALIDSPAEFPFVAASSGRDTAARPERPRFLATSVIPARETPPEPEPAGLPKRPREERLPQPWRDATPSAAVETQAARSPSPGALFEAELPNFAREAPALAQAPAVLPVPEVAAPASPTVAQIEILVARLITYYESGEIDNLMALVEPREAAFGQAARMRQAYAEFFRATRERRLRVKSLDWQEAPASARAHGMATVRAEYVDAPGSLERDVPVEMEIALRNGQAKITRLSLYPNTP